MGGTISLTLTGGGKRPLRLVGEMDLVQITGNFTFDNSYLNGGESLAPSDVSLQAIYFASFTPAICSTTPGMTGNNAVGVRWYNNKVICFEGDAIGEKMKELTGAQDLSKHVSSFLIVGYQ